MQLLTDTKSRSVRQADCHRIFISERDGRYRHWLVDELRKSGYTPVVVNSHGELVSKLESDREATVILGSEFDEGGPIAAFGRLLLDGFSRRVLFLVDEDQPEIADRGLRKGIKGFVKKSSDPSQLLNALSATIDKSPSNGDSALVGSSSAIRELRSLIKSVAAIDASVMRKAHSRELTVGGTDCAHVPTRGRFSWMKLAK